MSRLGSLLGLFGEQQTKESEQRRPLTLTLMRVSLRVIVFIAVTVWGLIVGPRAGWVLALLVSFCLDINIEDGIKLRWRDFALTPGNKVRLVVAAITVIALVFLAVDLFMEWPYLGEFVLETCTLEEDECVDMPDKVFFITNKQSTSVPVSPEFFNIVSSWINFFKWLIIGLVPMLLFVFDNLDRRLQREVTTPNAPNVTIKPARLDRDTQREMGVEYPADGDDPLTGALADLL